MKEFYQPSSKEVILVDVPEMQFIMIDGIGSPGDSEEYKNALAALYPIAFKTKFLSKAKGKDYVVPPLEGLWWADDMTDFREGRSRKLNPDSIQISFTGASFSSGFFVIEVLDLVEELSVYSEGHHLFGGISRWNIHGQRHETL